MLAPDEITNLAELLEERYGPLHETQRHLKRFFEGMIWSDEQMMTRSLVSVFRDLRHGGAEADREPDVRVTLPLIESVVMKYAAFLSEPPQINMLTPPIGYGGLRKTETARALADQNEKFLYGTWEQNNVSRHFKKQAFYLPCMGSSFTGAMPEFGDKKIKYLTRSPVNAYPIYNSEFEYVESIIFKWDVSQDQAMRMYGPEIADFVQPGRGNGITGMFGFGVKKNSNPLIQIVEHWDHDSKTTLVAGHKVSGVKHDLGFCPWVHTPFYNVPDEPFGRGVIEGNVPLFQKLNMLDSLELQAILENVFARMVIINPAVAPEDIDNGPGGVIPVGQGGDVKWVTPPATTTDLSNSMGRSMDMMQRGTHLPGSAYGESIATNITTGKAQSASLMPTGNMVEYVQDNISDSWERLNEMTIKMAGTVFKNRSVVYFGSQFTKEGLFSQPSQFTVELKGGDLQGWSRHELSFQPLMNAHEKIVMGLQLAGGGLVSKRWQRNQVGIVDNDAMQEEILAEMRLEQSLAAVMGMYGQGTIGPEQVESWFLAMEKGGTAPLPVPAQPAGAAPGAPAPTTGPMPGQAPPIPGAPLPSLGPPPLGPPGAAPDQGPPAPPTPQPSQNFEFTLTGAIGDFQRIKKIKGQVWLIGEIVQRGGTNGPIEVRISEAIDKSTIIHGLPDEYHGHLQFRVGHETPSEPHVEVTPGADATPSGGGVVDDPNAVAAGPGGVTPLEPVPSHSQTTAQPPLASEMPVGGFAGSLRS